jgi:hypothetical protein
MNKGQYIKELKLFMRFRITTNSKVAHTRKRNKILRWGVFGGYERISDNEFDIDSKIGNN